MGWLPNRLPTPHRGRDTTGWRLVHKSAAEVSSQNVAAGWERGRGRPGRPATTTQCGRRWLRACRGWPVLAQTSFGCPDNTAHMALEQPGAHLALPGLHIAQLVAEQAARDGRARVGVLGAKYTMDSDLYPWALAAWGIAAEVPDADERDLVNAIIIDELVNGCSPSTAVPATSAHREAGARGCDAVALVCAEIPLLVPPEAFPLPTLDSTRCSPGPRSRSRSVSAPCRTGAAVRPDAARRPARRIIRPIKCSMREGDSPSEAWWSVGRVW
jgi:hypothetical protein